ncbi:hypothetical protein UlMin_005695 [Ulmus minor]
MLRLHKSRNSAKSGDRIDFKFSNIKALQVPKGWDKLVISIVYVETGKTIAKSSKAVVRNESCQWTETISESIRVSQDDSSKEMEDCFLKLIVSMGSARSGILGEATINMTDYTSTSVPVSLPLKKCSYGTILQVKIQCITPRSKSRDEDSKENNFDLEKPKSNIQDSDIMSDGSNSTTGRSFRSSSTNKFRLTSHSGEPGSRDTSFSVSGSHRSYDSGEGSNEVESMSSGDHNGDVHGLIRREDSIGSENSSNHSSVSSRIVRSGNHSQHSRPEFAPSNSLINTASSRNLLEAAEGTIEELRAEAKMWERNARKLMLDLDVLRVEFSDQSKIQANLNLELSAAYAERNSLKKEVEQLKWSLEESMAKQTSSDDSVSQDADLPRVLKELKDELKFQKEANTNLSLQLKRSHESNIELVSVLQELEETIDQQKMEMEKTIEENIEENRKLTEQLQQLEESAKDLNLKVQLLEQALEKKNQDIENREEEYESKLSDKEKEVVELKEKLSESLDATNSAEGGSINGGDVYLIKEFEELKEKVQELERDCNELTDENLELLFKLKEANNGSKEENTSTDDNLSLQVLQSSKMQLEVKLAEMDKELRERKHQMENLQAELLSKEEEILVLRRCQTELEAKFETGNRELELHVSELEEENTQFSVLVSGMEAQLRHLGAQQETSRLELANSKSHAITLQEEINRVRVEMASEEEDLKQKLQNMQSQWSGTQDECESLRRANQKLQADLEFLDEEVRSLQELNEELKKQKLGLHEHCSVLEAKLQESLKSFSDCSSRVDELEENLSSVLAEIASKEKGLMSEIDALVDENLRYKEKLDVEESLLSQMYMEKVDEVTTLQQDVEHLTKQLSATHDEKERIASDGLRESSELCAQLDEMQLKIKQTENELNLKRVEHEGKLESLFGELAASKQNQKLLMEENEKVAKLLENYRSGEAKYKTMLNDFELKLTVSEYERQQLVEESTNLKVQLLKLAHLENQLLASEKELDAVKSEKEKLGEEKNALIEKISTLKNAMSELESLKIEKLALEEKLLQMEGDRVDKDALSSQNGELKSELEQISIEIRQCQLKMQQLEVERDEFRKRSQVTEEELKLMKEEKQNQREHTGPKTSNVSKSNARVSPVHETGRVTKNEMAKNSNQRRDSKRNASVKNGPVQRQKENGNGGEISDGSPRDNGADTGSKIRSLEDELAKALAEKNKYKVQLNKLLSEGQNNHTETLRNPTSTNEVVARDKYERTKSSLEAELRDIRERYSDMSLKYAEVEALREELVMKLKASSNGRRWFS